MAGILANLQTVNKRRLAIQKLFKPLARSSRVEVFRRSIGSDVVFGLGQNTPQLRAARHATRHDGIFMNYYEIWNQYDAKASYCLNKAYLHIHMANRNGTEDEELLALHTDPMTPAIDPSFKYKRGPHLHFSKAPGDLSKSHVALCLSDIDNVCNNMATFSNALDSAVGMINDEFFDRF